MNDDFEMDHGWAGDGSGTDDFQDLNQQESDDYRVEDDSFCDVDTPLGDELGG